MGPGKISEESKVSEKDVHLEIEKIANVSDSLADSNKMIEIDQNTQNVTEKADQNYKSECFKEKASEDKGDTSKEPAFTDEIPEENDQNIDEGIGSQEETNVKETIPKVDEESGNVAKSDETIDDNYKVVKKNEEEKDDNVD